jgi:O-antigen ligase
MILAIVISGIRSPLFRRNIILMVVGACAIGSAFSLRHYLQGTGEYGNGRTFALIQPDVFSAWEIFGFLGALVWLLRENSPIWLRGILIVSLLLIIAGIGLCGERAAILAGALGLFVVCICQKLVRQGLLIVAAVAAGALLLYVVEPDMFAPVLSRFDTIQEDRGSERLDIWTAALRVFCEAPIIGAGCDNFQFVVSRHLGEQVMSHSIYVGTLVELGIIGFAFLVAWIGVLLRKTWQAQDRLWVFPLLMVYLVQAAFLHEFYFSCFWLALGLAEGAAPARGSGASAQPQPVQQRLAGPPRSTRRGIGMSRIVPARMLRVGTWLSHNSMRPRAGDGRQ